MPLTGQSSSDRLQSWSTHGIKSTDQFAYFREAICRAFTNLAPEKPASIDFPATLEHIRIGCGALNRLAYKNYVVHRSLPKAASTSARCFYLNLKLAGDCNIRLADRELRQDSGQIALFDSARGFAIEHKKSSSFGVASLQIPTEALNQRLSTPDDVLPTRISDDPVLGPLIAMSMKTLNLNAARMAEIDSVKLFDVLLDLVALSYSRREYRGVRETSSIAHATTLAVHQAIETRIRKPGLQVSDIAASVGISERYVHMLLAKNGTTFSDHLMQRRLEGIAADLRDPKNASRDIGSIAFDWGFAELSHFSRRFKQRFGVRPRDWRG
ncbi:helix-turn-helix domain-containing protein [Tardiphaga alba]|uniref:Helix-turn-helix domain-containing protein n=1 Tax=Tardiphaga alba TaxID=340268 RepID=A0ABX8ADY4_9BRAD|nr:helix-turn-helix domain-containing protein [Tardiphaga alba]QUS41971.1 helix-turn-helix domain-containing protein [Tardiphaga alba]